MDHARRRNLLLAIARATRIFARRYLEHMVPPAKGYLVEAKGYDLKAGMFMFFQSAEDLCALMAELIELESGVADEATAQEIIDGVTSTLVISRVFVDLLRLRRFKIESGNLKDAPEFRFFPYDPRKHADFPAMEIHAARLEKIVAEGGPIAVAPTETSHPIIASQADIARSLNKDPNTTRFIEGLKRLGIVERYESRGSKKWAVWFRDPADHQRVRAWLDRN